MNESLFESLVDAVIENFQGHTDGYTSQYDFCKCPIFSEEHDTHLVNIYRDPVYGIDLLKMIASLNSVAFEGNSLTVTGLQFWRNIEPHFELHIDGCIVKQQVPTWIAIWVKTSLCDFPSEPA